VSTCGCTGHYHNGGCSDQNVIFWKDAPYGIPVNPTDAEIGDQVMRNLMASSEVPGYFGPSFADLLTTGTCYWKAANGRFVRIGPNEIYRKSPWYRRLWWWMQRQWTRTRRWQA
jgi:hypothetical protein